MEQAILQHDKQVEDVERIAAVQQVDDSTKVGVAGWREGGACVVVGFVVLVGKVLSSLSPEKLGWMVDDSVILYIISCFCYYYYYY